MAKYCIVVSQTMKDPHTNYSVDFEKYLQRMRNAQGQSSKNKFFTATTNNEYNIATNHFIAAIGHSSHF